MLVSVDTVVGKEIPQGVAIHWLSLHWLHFPFETVDGTPRGLCLGKQRHYFQRLDGVSSRHCFSFQGLDGVSIRHYFVSLFRTFFLPHSRHKTGLRPGARLSELVVYSLFSQFFSICSRIFLGPPSSPDGQTGFLPVVTSSKKPSSSRKRLESPPIFLSLLTFLPSPSHHHLRGAKFNTTVLDRG